MTDPDRFKLLGSYRTPRVRVGSRVTCESRDCDVIVTGYSDARIPWPFGRRPGSSARGLVLFGALAEAVRRESNQAVCHWFGVTPQTVTVWRKALGVGVTNPGTHRLRSDYTAEPWAEEARRKAHAKAGDPERRRKIAEAKREKKRPRHVIEAIRRANTGRVPTAETRAKLSAAAQARSETSLPSGRAWTADEDEMVRTLSAADVVARTSRSLRSVYARRCDLKVPDGRTRAERERAGR